MNKALFSYIAASPTAYHATAYTASLLRMSGYKELCEGDEWVLTPGHGYFVTRNLSSLIAFRIPKQAFKGFIMTAAHSDTPSYKIKENPELSGDWCTRLSAEPYGGMLCAPWFDRPLSIAGRVTVRKDSGFETRLIDLHEPCALIPNVAIHMNRTANNGMQYNAAVDMLPLYSAECEKGGFRNLIAKAAGAAEDDILTTDLYLYNPQPGVQWNGFISAPRLDDLQCAFSCLTAFMNAKESLACPIFCLFDNEEVGSHTKQGAASTFLPDVISRICQSQGITMTDMKRHIAASFLASCDNAHGIHPNHPEYADKNHTVYLNRGIVVKYNANNKYTSDAVSAAIFRLICEEAGVPVQLYANRADMPGGSTLGNIANTQVSLNTVDIGLAQLAMHSCYETAGAKDTEYMVKALTVLYEKGVVMEKDGTYRLV